MSNNLVPIDLQDQKSIEQFLNSPSPVVSQLLTGLFNSDFNWKYSAAKLVQASVKGQLFKQFGRELNELRAKGIIKEDYYVSNNNRATLLDLLKFLEEEVPDDEKFKALKSIFFASVTKQISEFDELLAYQLFQICKSLDAGEILLLKTCYDIKNGEIAPGLESNAFDSSSASRWATNISIQMGHGLVALTERLENRLIRENLMRDRQHPDRSGVHPGSRLTSLGEKLCEFITKYP